MPQTPTEEWLEELNTSEEEYMANLHRLGNLTLATKPDNSRMSNQLWEYKNEIIKSTAHLKLNMEILSIPKWTFDCITNRTNSLIRRICQIFPYPDVDLSLAISPNIVDEKTSMVAAINYMLPSAVEIRKNKAYTTDNGENGYIFLNSKMYPEGDKEKYWFGYRLNVFELVDQSREQFCVLVCRSKTSLIICLPRIFLDQYKDCYNTSIDNEGNITHYHIVVHRHKNKKVTMLLSKPQLRKVNISKYVVTEL